MTKKANNPADQKLGNTIQNCQFYGVKWDEAAIGAVISIARGIEENAKACAVNARALESMAQVLKASNVQIETMIKMEMPK